MVRSPQRRDPSLPDPARSPTTAPQLGHQSRHFLRLLHPLGLRPHGCSSLRKLSYPDCRRFLSCLSRATRCWLTKRHGCVTPRPSANSSPASTQTSLPHRQKATGSRFNFQPNSICRVEETHLLTFNVHHLFIFKVLVRNDSSTKLNLSCFGCWHLPCCFSRLRQGRDRTGGFRVQRVDAHNHVSPVRAICAQGVRHQYIRRCPHLVGSGKGALRPGGLA